MEYKGERICRVCGYVSFDCFRNEFGFPLYIICDVCGNESGYSDHTAEDIQYLEFYWINSGKNIKYENNLSWNININTDLIIENKKYKVLYEYIFQLILPESYAESFTVMQEVLIEGMIDFDSAVSALIHALEEGKRPSDYEHLAQNILHEIDHMKLQITPDQRAILERHASPSPPPNFSP